MRSGYEIIQVIYYICLACAFGFTWFALLSSFLGQKCWQEEYRSNFFGGILTIVMLMLVGWGVHTQLAPTLFPNATPISKGVER